MNKILLAAMITFSFSGLTFASSDRSDYGYAQINQQIKENNITSSMENSVKLTNKMAQVKNSRRIFSSGDRSDYGYAEINQQIKENRAANSIENRAKLANKTAQTKNFHQLDTDERAVLFREGVENGSAQAHKNIARKHMKDMMIG